MIERVSTDDPRRCVAARLDAGDSGELVVYATVLPTRVSLELERLPRELA